jgi:hypothetical protein
MQDEHNGVNMSYIIVQMEDPHNIETSAVLPDETGKRINKFSTEIDAKKFLIQLGIEDELDYDVQIVRLH